MYTRLLCKWLSAFSVLLCVSSMTSYSFASEDPLFFRQWQFEGNATYFDPENYSLGVIGSERSLGQGEDNVIMLITFGAKTDHEDLSEAYWANSDEIPGDDVDNDGNGYVDDVHGINTALLNGDLSDGDGFGTAFVGIVGATVNNGLGLRGITQNTKIVVCKIHDNFNELKTERQIEIMELCVDYALELKKKGVNIFAIANAFSEHPFAHTLELETRLKLYLSMIEKLEANNLLWLKSVPVLPETYGYNYFLDQRPVYPLALHSPNVIAAARLNRNLTVASNFGRAVTTSVVTEDIVSTTYYDRIESNGKYFIEYTPESKNIELAGFVENITHPDDPNSLAWFVPNDPSGTQVSEITFPLMDLSKISSSELMFDVSVKRNRAHLSFNDYGYPIYQSNGYINIQFRIDGSENWQTFGSQFLSARGIWDLYPANLDFESHHDEVIMADSKIQFRLQITGNETYIEHVKIWEADEAIWSNGYDNAYPSSASLAVLSGLAGIIKSHHGDWPAWKIANAITAGSSFGDLIASHHFTQNTAGVGVLTLINNGEGALDCKNKIIQRRLLPATNDPVLMVVNETYRVKTKSLNCENPGPPFTYTDISTGDKFVAADDGESGDRIAGDGQGILKYIPSATGITTLINEYDSDLDVHVFNRYHPVEQRPTSWIDTSDSVSLSWYTDQTSLRLGGLNTSLSQGFTASLTGFWGITSNEMLQITKEADAGPYLDSLNIREKRESIASTSSEDSTVELSSAVFDSNLFVDKKLNSFRIYVAPKNSSDYVINRNRKLQSERGLVLIAEFGTEHGEDFLGKPFIQIVFRENQGAIQFNYGTLPDFLEGVEYEIGIEIGDSYRQRTRVTLASNTTYLLDVDSDFDGIIDTDDPDDDNDGVEDTIDEMPYDGGEFADSDGDGIGNNADTDDDNDGVVDLQDAFPLNPDEDTDTDADGVGNNEDTDDDNDGVLDSSDAFPFNPSEYSDTDHDGIGDNQDSDDDNDGIDDIEDDFPLDPTEYADADSDGMGDNQDPDDDNDGVNDGEDAFPFNAEESVDTDGDGIGNNQDSDDDNDGVADEQDAYPLDATKSSVPVSSGPKETTSSGGGSMGLLLPLVCVLLIRRSRKTVQTL